MYEQNSLAGITTVKPYRDSLAESMNLLIYDVRSNRELPDEYYYIH